MPDLLSGVPRPPACVCCGYDLTGIAAEAGWAKCPECGETTNLLEVPRPVREWWRWPAAVVAGVAAMFVGGFLWSIILDNLLRGSRRDLAGVSLVACVLFGGAVSHRIIWRYRVARLRWEYRTNDLPARALRVLLVDFVCDCVLNVGMVLWGLLVILGTSWLLSR